MNRELETLAYWKLLTGLGGGRLRKGLHDALYRSIQVISDRVGTGPEGKRLTKVPDAGIIMGIELLKRCGRSFSKTLRATWNH